MIEAAFAFFLGFFITFGLLVSRGLWLGEVSIGNEEGNMTIREWMKKWQRRLMNALGKKPKEQFEAEIQWRDLQFSTKKPRNTHEHRQS